ncbi:MAG: aspartate aminotransferase family protein [Candidatus Hydrogenedentes bacterium]|nr:aspartate aminotransferase family protein [Candidatus Hydrogenedentota bacterium]
MQLPAKGLSKDEILARLEALKVGDIPWRSGKIMAYVYDPGAAAEDVIKNAYMMYLTESGLDPTTYPSVMQLERQTVRMIIDLLRGDEKVVGSFTSGGTESILLAIKTARDMMRKERPEITQPEMIFPQTAHSAFYKAAAYFDVKPVAVPFDPKTFQVDLQAMEAAITPDTILLVGSAPGYAQGVVDPIPEIGQLALKHKLLCHVDGCVGGIHLSIMRKAGMGVPDFDWSVPGVTSISTDLHKFGYAAKNASIIMYRNKDIRRHQIFACTRTTTYALINPTIMSTKSGGPIAAAWAVLNFLGEEGYMRIVREVQEATWKMIDAINATGELRVLGKPDMCMFSFVSDSINVFQLADKMAKRGWYLQPQFRTPISPANLHITMNRSSAAQTDRFITELRESLAEVKAEPHLDPELVRTQVQGMLEQFGEGAVEQLNAMAGLEGGALPESMAMLNTLLDVLPSEIREPLLVEFMNELYV